MKSSVFVVMYLCSLLCALASEVSADVMVTNATFTLRPSNPPYSWVAILTAPTPNQESYLGVQVGDLGGGSYEFSTGLIAGDYSWFSVSPGLEFTTLYVASRVSDYGVFNFFLNETKHFAHWADVFPGGVPEDPDNSDNYGWVSVTHTLSGLVISDSATAEGDGIIVGTYTQVPEPATIFLFGLGGFGAWLLRRNKKFQDV